MAFMIHQIWAQVNGTWEYQSRPQTGVVSCYFQKSNTHLAFKHKEDVVWGVSRKFSSSADAKLRWSNNLQRRPTLAAGS